MKKYHPKRTKSILFFVAGIICFCLIPAYIAVFKTDFSNSILLLFFAVILGGFLCCSEFLGNKILLTPETLIVYEWYKKKYTISLSEITDARIGLFCKKWWSDGDKVLSAKIITKETTMEFPLASYSQHQIDEIMEAIKPHK